MDEKEFKLFFKNKSPLLYTYLLGHVISNPIAEDLLSNIFARFYRTRLNYPSTLSREKWLLLITKKFMIDYYAWRMTEEGQQLANSGLTSYECSHLMEQHNAQLKEWMNEMTEAEQVAVNENVLTDLAPPEVQVNLLDRFRAKVVETEKAARNDKSTVDYWKEKIDKVREDRNGKSPKK